MFKIIFTIFLILNLSYAATIDRRNSCLTVSSTPTSQCTNKPKFIKTNINFGQLQPGSSDNIYQMPIYVNTNTNEKIEISMKPIKIRSKKNKRKARRYIESSFTSLLTGRTTVLKRGKKVEILPRGHNRFRDGHTLVGYITYMLPTISELESTAKYRATAKIKVYNQFKSGKGKVKIKYSIKPILVVGLFDVSDFFGDKLFKYARVDFGMLNYKNETVKEADVYVKTNYQNMSVYMTFNDIPPLYHRRAQETIDVQYSYKQKNRSRYQSITQGSEILLFSHFKNDGTKPVGTLKFVAERAEGKLSGNYYGKIRVTISAQ